MRATTFRVRSTPSPSAARRGYLLEQWLPRRHVQAAPAKAAMGSGLCVIPNVHDEHDVRVSEHDGSSKPNSISSRPIGDPPAIRSSPSNSVTTPLSFMLSDVVLPRAPPSMTSRETSPNTASAKGTALLHGGERGHVDLPRQAPVLHEPLAPRGVVACERGPALVVDLREDGREGGAVDVLPEEVLWGR